MDDSRQARMVSEDLRFATLSVMLGASLLLLSVVTWSQEDGEVFTLWGRLDHGWMSVTTLVVVVLTALSSISVGVDRLATRVSHVLMIICGLVAATGALLVPAEWEGSHTAPARWFAVLAGLAIAALNGDRLGQLRNRG